MTFDEKVDKVLDRVSRGDRVNIFSIIMTHAKEGEKNEQRLIASFMEGKDLIRKENDSIYVIGTTGINIINDYGSWLNYKTHERSKKKKENVKFWIPITISILALLISGITSYIKYKQDKEEPKINELKTQIDSLYTKTQNHRNLLKKADKEIIKIEKSLDSLKSSLKVGSKKKK